MLFITNWLQLTSLLLLIKTFEYFYLFRYFAFLNPKRNNNKNACFYPMCHCLFCRGCQGVTKHWWRCRMMWQSYWDQQHVIMPTPRCVCSCSSLYSGSGEHVDLVCAGVCILTCVTFATRAGNCRSRADPVCAEFHWSRPTPADRSGRLSQPTYGGSLCCVRRGGQWITNSQMGSQFWGQKKERVWGRVTCPWFKQNNI